LEESDLYQLKTKAEAAENEGRDLLDEMASRVKEDIALAKRKLEEIIKGKFHNE
jgi:hypothetical protein